MPRGVKTWVTTDAAEIIKDTFYHNGKWKHEHKNRPFISCDLETYTPEDTPRIMVKDQLTAQQQVMLFGFSCCDEHMITGPDIRSADMIRIMADAAKKHKDGIFFGFHFKFDVNFIFRDLKQFVLNKALKDGEKAYYRGYCFEYLAGKYLAIRYRHEWSIRIYEVAGWFNNSSLINAYQEHIGEDEDYVFVAKGKEQRNVFDFKDLDTLVLPYWKVEQTMYVRLMERMRSLVLEAGLPLPSAWYGPSALVQRVYESRGVKKHLRSDREVVLDDEFIRICQRGYFGGRFEPFKGGYHNGPVYQYDLKSAYPSAMLDLWSWQGASLVWIDGSKCDRTKPMPASYRYSVWDVRFTHESEDAFISPMPFPHRTRQGNIYYPHTTTTTVWSPEMELHWFNPNVEILAGCVIQETGQRPFEFIGELFNERARLAAEGNPAQYAIKIAINSGYGKLAQRKGARLDQDGNWHIPAFHQLDYAGYITSHCRAAIWRAMSLVGFQNVISVETDALYTTVPMPDDTLPRMHCSVPFRIGKQLKTWEAEEWDGMILLQSGIYWKRSYGEWKKGQTRGLAKVGSKGVTAQDALAFLDRLQSDPGSTLDTSITSFHGIGRMKYPDWLTWTTDPKSIKFGGSGKRIYWPAMTDGIPSEQMVNFFNGSVGFKDNWYPQSAPHPLVWNDYGDYSNKEKFDMMTREDGQDGSQD